MVDIIDAGYLKKEDRKLVLFDKGWVEISSFEIDEPTVKSLGCSMGFKFSCSQKIGKDEKPEKSSEKPQVDDAQKNSDE